MPALLVLVLLSALHNQRENQLWTQRTERNMVRIGEVLLTGMHQAIHQHDPQMLSNLLADVVKTGVAERVQLVDMKEQVKADSRKEKIGTIYQRDEPGCVECHGLVRSAWPQAVELRQESQVLRVAVPIANEADCVECHAQDGPHLGVLLADISMAPVHSHLEGELRSDLAVSIASAILVILGMSFLVHRLVVQRVEALHQPLVSLAAGDLSARLPAPSAPLDELSQLSIAFNRMANELEEHVQDREERAELRQRAITEERERLARELHDGMAQVLGYVNTKAMATRLLLKKQQWQAADNNLAQLEEAARSLLVDVREAILGLRLAGHGHAGLVGMLQESIAQYNRLTGLSVALTVSPEISKISLPPDVELQLLRIVQESLANVRKHARATHAEVDLCLNDGSLKLGITDDGRGFDPNVPPQDSQPHFGLSTVRERVAAIGAQLALDSCPGSRTCVIVQLPLTKGE